MIDVTLLAWVGEDEFGSGVVGLKQALVPAGQIPLVAIDAHRNRLDTPHILAQLQAQADRYGKVIRLVRFVSYETVLVLNPRPQG